MKQPSEEALAAALWAFVERAREDPGAVAAGLDGLTPADVEELVALFRTAADVPGALEEDAEPVPGSAAERVRAAIAARAPAGGAGPPAAAPARRPGLLPTLPRWALAGLAAASLAGAFFAGRALPARPPQRVVIREHAEPVHVSCREAKARFEAILKGTLGDREKSEALWHAAVCPPCLDHLYTVKHRHDQEQPTPPKA